MSSSYGFPERRQGYHPTWTQGQHADFRPMNFNNQWFDHGYNQGQPWTHFGYNQDSYSTNQWHENPTHQFQPPPPSAFLQFQTPPPPPPPSSAHQPPPPPPTPAPLNASAAAFTPSQQPPPPPPPKTGHNSSALSDRSTITTASHPPRPKAGQNISLRQSWTLDEDPNEHQLQLQKRATLWRHVITGYQVQTPDEHYHNVPASVVFEHDKDAAHVQGVRVPASVYDALSAIVYSDCFQALTAKTKHLQFRVPKNDGRTFVKVIAGTNRSVTSQTALLQAKLTRLTLRSKADWERFYGEWCMIEAQYQELPDGIGAQLFNNRQQRDHLLRKIKDVFPQTRAAAFSDNTPLSKIIKDCTTLSDLAVGDAQLATEATAFLADPHGAVEGDDSEETWQRLDADGTQDTFYSGHMGGKGAYGKGFGNDSKRRRLNAQVKGSKGGWYQRGKGDSYPKGKGGKGKGGKGVYARGYYRADRYVRSFVVHVDEGGNEYCDHDEHPTLDPHDTHEPGGQADPAGGQAEK